MLYSKMGSGITGRTGGKLVNYLDENQTCELKGWKTRWIQKETSETADTSRSFINCKEQRGEAKNHVQMTSWEYHGPGCRTQQGMLD